LYWAFHNGVRRRFYHWLYNRNAVINEWPRPTVGPFDVAGHLRFIRECTADSDAFFITDTGWYDAARADEIRGPLDMWGVEWTDWIA